MSIVSDDVEPLSFVFEDDGLVPNNPMPFLVYKGAIDVDNEHPEKTIEGLFGANGWGEMWRNGVYDYMPTFTRRSALPAAMRGCGSAATVAVRSKSRPAMSPSCPQAPDINACPRAGISA